jgi:hypothetical protein
MASKAATTKLMTNTTGSLGFLAACSVGENVVALVDRRPSVLSRTRVLPVLLNSRGELLHVGKDLKISEPRFADAVQTGPNEVIVVVTSRPDGIGLLGIPYFFRCAIEKGRLRVESLGRWRAGISIQSSSFFLREGDQVAFAGMYATSTRQALKPGWRLAYGAIRSADQRITPQHIAAPPTTDIEDLHAVTENAKRWLFAVAVDHFKRIEVWEDPGAGAIRHVATLATASDEWSELSSPMIMPCDDGYLVLWRAWNGKTRGDVCDGSLWYAKSDRRFRSVSPAKRLSADRTVPTSRHIRLCQHSIGASLSWQNGMSADRSPVRWAVLGPKASLPSAARTPQSLRPPFPTHIVETAAGYVVLRNPFRMNPYEWSLTAELVPRRE